MIMSFSPKVAKNKKTRQDKITLTVGIMQFCSLVPFWLDHRVPGKMCGLGSLGCCWDCYHLECTLGSYVGDQVVGFKSFLKVCFFDPSVGFVKHTSVQEPLSTTAITLMYFFPVLFCPLTFFT